MNLKEIRQEGLKEILDILEEVFSKVGVDFYYLIGATARDLWFQKEGIKSRATKDIDFAVLISNQNQFENIKRLLKNEYGFSQVKDNEFTMVTPKGTTLDILPFGAVEVNDGEVIVAGQGMHNIKVNGFEEVANGGIIEVTHEKYKFKIASLPSIILLKLIAYDDRPEVRTKDAGDIAQVIKVYFEIESELIYDEHNDLFDEGNENLEVLSAEVIGRTLNPILAENKLLKDRIIYILNNHTRNENGNSFVELMARTTNDTVEHCIKLLKSILKGIEHPHNK